MEMKQKTLNGNVENGSEKMPITANIFPGIVRLEVNEQNRERIYYLLKDMGCEIKERRVRL